MREALQTASPDDQGHFVIRGVPLERKIGLRFVGDGFAPFFDDSEDPYSSPLRITMHPASIERIDIQGNRRIPEETIRFYIRTRPGEPYSKVQLDSDMLALYKANFFDHVEIKESDGNTGKIIAFIVGEKPIIRTIEYVGNKSFTESEILDAYRENKIGLTVDVQYEFQKIRAAERILKDLMIRHGKPLGTVHTEIETIPPANVRVRFVMDEDAKGPQ